MEQKDPTESEVWLRNLRIAVLAPLAWLVLVVILPDFVFGLTDTIPKSLVLVRHTSAAVLLAAACFYLLYRIRTHTRIVLPTLTGMFFMLIALPFRIAHESHLLDGVLDPRGFRVMWAFDNALNALGLAVIAGGFLLGLIELLAAKQRSDAEHQRLVREMAERQRAEEDRVRLATAIEQGAESVLITDHKGVIQYVNPAFERLTGYTREEAVGQTPRIMRSGKHDGAFYRKLWQTISRGDTWHGRFINKRKDGSFFEEEATISCVRNAAGAIINYVAIKRNVTNERNLERQLRQAQKMEAIGTLAGRIAHDFNNILALILGHSEIAGRSLAEGHPVRFNIQHIIKAGNRAKDLVRQILTFSRQIDYERKPVQIRVIVTEVLDALQASLPSTVTLRSRILPDCGWVLADPTHIHQVAMNLCTNAIQAMEGRSGILEVSLESAHIPAGFVADVGMPAEGEYVRLTVSDTGQGMDSATLQRIFDPFFTTKEPRGGTGLGLSTVHGIVMSCGGAITVNSQPGAGSTFRVFFPRMENGLDAHDQTADPVAGGREHILIVDDAPEIVQMTTLVLRQLGYRVEPFTDSVSALRAFRAKPADFDLVIAEQVMPDLTGLELAQEMMTIRPDLPVILITGFGHDVTGGQAKLAGIAEYLMKPIATHDLSAAIRRCLDKTQEH